MYQVLSGSFYWFFNISFVLSFISSINEKRHSKNIGIYLYYHSRFPAQIKMFF